MTLTELEEKVPALKEYTKTMPPEIRSRCTVRTHAAGSIIHQKDMELNYFGIVAAGENRVINEFENGNVYMIEGNKAIDFIGEVTILAGMPRTSVTIEAVTDNVVAYISRRDAQQWLSEDMNILRLTARHTAFKLQWGQALLPALLSAAGLPGALWQAERHGKRPSPKNHNRGPDPPDAPGGNRRQCQDTEQDHPPAEGGRLL